MTNTAVAITILFVFSVLVGRFIRRFQTPHFILSGMVYLLFGLVFGPHLGLGLLSHDLLYKFEPLTDLLTGTAGFLLGLRIRILHENKEVFISGFLTALVTFFIMIFCFFALAHFAVDFSQDGDSFKNIPLLHSITPRHLWFSFGVSATACSSSLLSFGAVSRFEKNHSNIIHTLSVMAPAVQITAIILMGGSLALARSKYSASSLDLSVLQWLLTSLFSGVLCAMLFSLFIAKKSESNRIMLAALGTLTFACGIGTTLNISPLFVCLILGISIGLFSSHSEVLKNALIQIEEPVFVLLLIIGGATWQPEISGIWMLPGFYFIIRFTVFSTLTHRIHNRLSKKKFSRLGHGLLGQDLIAVAMALSLSKAFPNISQLFLTTIFGSIFLNDIIAVSLLKRVILDNEQAIEVKPILKEREVL